MTDEFANVRGAIDVADVRFERMKKRYEQQLRDLARIFAASALGYSTIDWSRSQARAVRKGCVDPRRLCRRPP